MEVDNNSNIPSCFVIDSVEKDLFGGFVGVIKIPSGSRAETLPAVPTEYLRAKSKAQSSAICWRSSHSLTFIVHFPSCVRLSIRSRASRSFRTSAPAQRYVERRHRVRAHRGQSPDRSSFRGYSGPMKRPWLPAPDVSPPTTTRRLQPCLINKAAVSANRESSVLRRLRALTCSAPVGCHQVASMNRQAGPGLYRVSRTPVREAMSLLEDEGFLVRQENCGYFVAEAAI